MNKKALAAFVAALAVGSLLGATALGSAFAGSAESAPQTKTTIEGSAVAGPDGAVSGVSGGVVIGDPSDPALGELQSWGTVTINADGTATDVVKDADGKVISTRQVPLGQENVLPTE